MGEYNSNLISSYIHNVHVRSVFHKELLALWHISVFSLVLKGVRHFNMPPPPPPPPPHPPPTTHHLLLTHMY